jgi:hypothetical protein
MKYFLLNLAFALLLSGCTSYQTNPEYTECINSCRNSKNKCMMNANTATAVEKCDQSYVECMEKCSKMPQRIEVK